METKQRKIRECPILLYPEKCTGCRNCQIRCSIRQLGEFNPARSYIVVKRDHGIRTSYLGFTDDCTWCGYCARFCAYGALKLKKLAKEGGD
jgi:ferredoxin